MKKALTSVAVAALAVTATACAQAGGQDVAVNAAPQAQAQTSAPAAEITDAELAAYAAARAEIEPITTQYAAMSAEQRTAATAQIVEIQQRHNLTPARYDAITRAMREDTQLAQRATAQGGFTEAQLRAFAEASLAIDPLSRQFASANAATQEQLTTQMREVLDEHSLDGATYNAIASAAQTDSELAAQIAALQVAAQAADPATGE